MSDTFKRYMVSTIETFLAGFLPIFLIQIESIIDSWEITTATLSSAICAWIFAWTKLVLKIIRERIQKKSKK